MILSVDRWLPPLLLAAGLVAVVAVLAAVPYLPFVDLPNHQLVLEMARAFRAGETSRYFEPAEGLVFTYTLFARLDALLAPLLSVAASVRLMTIAAVAALPLAVWFLARRVAPGIAVWAGVLALPLAVSWPARLGFLSYLLGLPCALCAAAWAIDTCAAGTGWRRAGRAALVAVALAVAYAAHPMTLAFGGALVALAWFTFGTPRAWLLLLLAATALPAAALAGWDVTHGGLERVAGIDAPVSTEMVRRSLAQAAGQLVTFGLDVQSWSDLAWVAPFGLAVVALAVLGLGRAVGARAGIFAGVAALAHFMLALFIPSAIPGAVLVGERVAAFAFALAALPAAWGLVAAPRAARVVALLAVALAVGHALARVVDNGARIARLVGPRPPAILEGRYTAIIADCAPRDERLALAVPYEPLYHVWAYTVSPTRGFMPYTFATRRYQAARHRAGEFILTRGPELARAIPGAPDLCERMVQRMLAESLRPRAHDFAGALLIGERSLLDRLVSKRPEERRWLGPGMVVMRRIPGRG